MERVAEVVGSSYPPAVADLASAAYLFSTSFSPQIMSNSSSELLSEVRDALEHQLDAFGPLIYEDESPKSSEKEVEEQKESISETPHSLPAEETAPDAAPETAPTPSNLFGESVPTAVIQNVESNQNVESPYVRIEKLIPTDSPLHRLGTLEEVASYVSSTILVPLDETRTNPVFGVGNPNADLMVIGEAPGADEDRQGEPFVGRAGQLLTKILKAIGFERSDVYIANILKSRPPNNRDPLPQEIEAHIPILYKQIALIQPKLLLCVGKTAGTSLLNQKTSLAKLRGTFHDYHGLPVLVTYHPAALLRNPHWKRPTWEDVQILRSRYDELGGS